MSDGADAEERVWLFSYGTLRQPEVQQALFGRAVDEEEDALPGYRLESLTISDPQVVATSGSATHPILRPTSDYQAKVPGAALAITRAELAIADAYEVADYARVSVTLASGRLAFAYVAARST